jgi:maltoporin
MEVWRRTFAPPLPLYASFVNGIGDDQFRLRETFVQAGNGLQGQQDAKFWAGEKYYRRQHIDKVP